MMTEDQVKQLELSWDLDFGFLGKLRQGIFDMELYGSFISLLHSIHIEEEGIPKRIVALLWYIPLFMEWQKERITDSISEDDYKLKRTEIENQLEEILGVP